MLRPIDNYFLQLEEPHRSCLQFLRNHILQLDSNISEVWKYRMPFYCYEGKMFCYLWVHKKYQQAYFGIVQGKQIDHPDLLQEKRARMKILLIDPAKNIPVGKINVIMQKVLKLFKQ